MKPAAPGANALHRPHLAGAYGAWGAHAPYDCGTPDYSTTSGSGGLTGQSVKIQLPAVLM